ncbi:MAG: hypothetical protein LBL13_01095 [Bacteroidales bacterium]|jgi:hypothetical protein|nr:hypothetical protein [Bacteroidales bacterium]
MTDRQGEKLEMYARVVATCKRFLSVYSNIPTMVNALELLEKGIVEIQQASQQQAENNTYGLAEEKNKEYEGLSEQAIKIANILYIFAFINKDYVLKSKVNVNKSMFYNTRDNDVIILANVIAAEAEKHIDEIKDYGIDQTEIDILKNAIATFTTHIQKLQTTKKERKVATTNLKFLFAKVDSVVYDLLDKHITLFKSSAPDFYLQYKAARNLIEMRRKKQERRRKRKQERN